MFSVSEKYSKAILADTRDMPYRVTLAGTIPLDQSKIPSMTLTESASGSSSISIGTANSASLKLTLKNADVVDYSDILVEPESGLVLPDGTIEWVPLGKFWVTNPSTSDDYKTVTLICADGMYHLTGSFESEITYPTTLKAFVNELNAKAGVDFVGLDSLPDVIIRRKPEKMTYREAYGYAAGCCGKNARFNREGKMEFFWYSDTGITIERTSQYLNGMTRLNDKPLNVTFEVTGNQEAYIVTCISDGNGGVTATPGQNILEGETVVLSINPFSEYELATITAITDSGVEVTLYKDAEGGYTFIQPDSNVTVTASFRVSAEGPFNLTVRAYDGGSINYGISDHEAGNSYFNMGDTVTIFVTPHSGFAIDKLITIPANINLVEAGTTDEGNIVYEFTMPQSDVTINAYFKDADTYYTIERIADPNGLPTTPGYVENVTMTYTNPLIYEKMVPTISELVQGVTYTPCKVKHRGNPAFQPGDILTVPDKNGEYHTVLIMQQTMTFGGGMNSELMSYGQTEKQSSFSADGPITAQIKQTVKQANADLERRLSANNALVFASLHRTIGNTEAKIKSIVEWQTNTGATKAELSQVADNLGASISLVVAGAGEDARVRADIIMKAINNDSSSIKISADKIDIEGKNLNIKVDATNIEGTLTAKQINADGIVAKDVNLSGKIIASEGSFGDSHITSDGKIFGIPYTGYYFGSTTNDTFFGNLSDTASTAYQRGYRAVLGLGMAGGTASDTDCVLLTNKDIQFGGNGAWDPITWNELRKAISFLKKTYPDWFK